MKRSTAKSVDRGTPGLTPRGTEATSPLHLDDDTALPCFVTVKLHGKGPIDVLAGAESVDGGTHGNWDGMRQFVRRPVGSQSAVALWHGQPACLGVAQSAKPGPA
jgi:hypothetical protein